METFVYLGGTNTQSGKYLEDSKNRIGKALDAVQNLQSILTARILSGVKKLEL